MFPTKKCPVCGSINLTAERMIDGLTRCNDCKFSGKHSAFVVKLELTVVPYVSHAEVREHLSMWSRSARELMSLYITQQEAFGIKNEKKIELQEQLIKVMEQKDAIQADRYLPSQNMSQEDAEMFNTHLNLKIEKIKNKLKKLS